MRRTALLPLLLLTLGAVSTAPPGPGEIPALAEQLAGFLAGTPAEGRLTAERIPDAFATIGEAGAWPETWLIVRNPGEDEDVVLDVRLAPNRTLARPAVVAAVPRQEWAEAKQVAAAVKAAGARPPRLSNVVQVEYSVKTVTTYVYALPKVEGKAQGLMALVPPGGLLREAANVDLGDGARHTLAVILREASFVPSGCRSCEALVFGHADSGRIELVLAGEKELEDTLDLTPHLSAEGATPLLPRYACGPDDRNPDAASREVGERFANRPPVPLLALRDLDGDRRALEVSFPVRTPECEAPPRTVRVGIDAGTRKLRVLAP